MRPRSSTTRRLLSLLVAMSVMTLYAATSVFAAAPNTAFDAFFTTQEYLEPASQTNAMWGSTIPNALAGYYTYIPLSNADAIAVGFPSACGNPNTVTNPYTSTVIHTPTAGPAPSDAASTADCYIISVRQFKQPTSLDFLKFVLPEWPATTGANLFPGPGLVNPGTGIVPTSTPFVDTTNVTTFLATMATSGTTAWGYGSGGKGWQPYGPTGPAIRGCAPHVFQTTPFNFLFGAAPTGDQSLSNTGTGGTGVWHFPAPTIKGTKTRPVYVQWLNDLPNVEPPGLDPSVDCGVNALNCFPYNRIVTHVHGAHVRPESDGLATAWYTPNFVVKGEGFFPASDYLYTAPAGKAAAIGPIYFYPMDQEAGTIWYHDHSIGSTHLNTNQGMAGFFPITDTNEIALQTDGVPAVINPPAPAIPPTLPTGNFELGFALQDRHFDINAQMVMPNYPIYDKLNASLGGCVDLPSGVPDPATCVRVDWMKAADGHLIPYVPGDPLLANPNNAGAPFGATSATLEYFGVMPVVNGVTYGTYPVGPGVYRMRFIGGTDSRAWIMQLQTATGTVIPFWQIGSEQGLLDKPVQRDIIDLMGGERIDVLVDFNVLNVAGTVPATRVFLKNLGEDAPYAGTLVTDPLTPPVPATVIPDIMAFDVATGLVNYNSKDPAALAAAAGTPLRPGAHALPALTTPAYTRTIALVEITDGFGRTMPTIDARGYRPNEVPITENILINQIEQWDIINTTVDAHPMHLHQVAFQLINRQAVNAFAAPINNLGEPTYAPSFPLFPANGLTEPSAVYASSQYAPVGPVINPQPYETLALKDTVDCPPSYVTRVLTKFDILGTYVWHCHILSHEEHDMMRPFRVVANKLLAPASITVPATATAGTVNVVVAATASPVPGAQYVVQFRKVGAPFWHTNQSAVPNPTVDLKVNPALPETADLGPGVYEFRAQAVDQILQGTAATNYADSDWVYGGNNVVFPMMAITSPNGGETLTGLSKYNVTWTYKTGANLYVLYYSATGAAPWTVVTTVGNVTSYNWTVPNISTTTAVFRISAFNGATWLGTDVSNANFSITPAALPMAITSPNGGETLTGLSPYNVTWTPQTGANLYVLYYSATGAAPWTVVTTVGNVTSYNWAVPNISTTTAVFRISAFNGATWLGTDVSNANFSITPAPLPMAITSPNGGETLTGFSKYNVTWTPQTGANLYTLYYSATGAAPWTVVTALGNVTSYNWTVPNISTTTARFRISAFNGATWLRTDVSDANFTIIPGALPMAITSPNGGETLAGLTTYNVTWTPQTGANLYTLYYSATGSAPWTVITAVGNVTSYNWTVPSLSTTTARFRISAFNGAAWLGSDISNAVFTITP